MGGGGGGGGGQQASCFVAKHASCGILAIGLTFSLLTKATGITINTNRSDSRVSTNVLIMRLSLVDCQFKSHVSIAQDPKCDTNFVNI